jgi:hypothetical protein
MTEAIQKGFYDVEGYEEMLGTDDHNRVLLQEFGCANTRLHSALAQPPLRPWAVQSRRLRTDSTGLLPVSPLHADLRWAGILAAVDVAV